MILILVFLDSREITRARFDFDVEDAGYYNESSDLLPVKINVKWKYIDSDGEFLPGEFEITGSFYNHQAVAYTGGKWVVLDENRNQKMLDQFEDIKLDLYGCHIKNGVVGGYCMSEGTKAIIALMAGAVVYAVCIVRIFLKGRTRKEKFIDRAKKNGWYTEAEEIKYTDFYGNPGSDSDYGRRDHRTVIYRYYVNGVAYKKKLSFETTGILNTPSRITVYYNPKHPRRAVSQEDVNRNGSCLLTIILVLGTIFLVAKILGFEGR